MRLSLPIPASQRRRRWSVLLLLALALVTGLSVATALQSRARLAEVDELILPSVRLVHEMTVVVDEVRGLSALHLLRADAAAQRDLEDRMQAARQRVERRMAVSRHRLADDTERRHFQRVRASLTAYWAAQDRLLAASRQAAGTPQAAATARALMAGDSQSAFQQLRADLEAWWAYTDGLSGVAGLQGAHRARLQALLLGLQALLLLGLGACLLGGRRRPATGARQPGGSAAPPKVPPPLPLAQLAFQARLLALNVAVATARRGVGRSSRTPAEQDLGRLAARLGATATRLSALADSLRTEADTGDQR